MPLNLAPAPTVPWKPSRSAAVKSPLSSVPVPVIALVNVPPEMVPLHSTEADTGVLPALKVASASTVMLWMLVSVKAMVSGASEPVLRSISPMMVSTPLSRSKAILLNVPPVMAPLGPFSTVAPVKSPPEMVPGFRTSPVNVPPVMVPSFPKNASSEISTFVEPVISPVGFRQSSPSAVIVPPVIVLPEMVPPMLNVPPSAIWMSLEKFEFRQKYAPAAISMLVTAFQMAGGILSLSMLMPVTVSLPSAKE